MATLPSANTRLETNASGFAGGSEYFCLFAPVAQNADVTPRVFASTQGILAQHSYSAGSSLAASIITEAKKPVVFVGLPIVTAGAITSQRSAMTGTSRITAGASASGIMEELDGVVEVTVAGTIGSGVGPSFNLSLDGGRTRKPIRLGTANSYVIPHVGVTLSFSAGALVVGDVYQFRTTAPKADNAGFTAARTALAAQTKLIRQITVLDEVSNATEAGYITAQANAYETSNKRFTLVRAPVRDGGVVAARSSGIQKNMVPGTAETVAFAEVGASGDTITRSVGSWITDGFAVGDAIVITGTASNNITAKIVSLSATVITLGTEDLTAETIAAASISIAASASISFAEVGSTGDTITRSSGSWITDGFAVGDSIKVTGTTSNNITGTIAALSATVITLDAEDVIDEVVASHKCLVVQVVSKPAHVAKMDALLVAVDSQKRIDLGYGRARKVCPITGWNFRRSMQWAATIRDAQLQRHIPCWRVDDGPVDGFSLNDENGQLVEFDERVDGGALAARFSCLTTLDNGPSGTFVALSLTRDVEGSLLSRTHNMSVANLVCTIVQAETSRFIGNSLVLNRDGTISAPARKKLETRVNKSLSRELLVDKEGEGPITSYVRWEASAADVLNYVGAPMNGVAELLLNGTLEQINTVVAVQTGG